MHTQLTKTDVQALARCLTLLTEASVSLHKDAEAADIEDALLDEYDAFTNYPLSTLLSLAGPDTVPLFGGVLHSYAPIANEEALIAFAEAAATAFNADLREAIFFPDPDAAPLALAGSLRLRVGPWDVADINIPSVDTKLAIISALLPPEAEAATFTSAIGVEVVLAVSGAAPEPAIQELFSALEKEFDVEGTRH